MVWQLHATTRVNESPPPPLALCPEGGKWLGYPGQNAPITRLASHFRQRIWD